MMQSTLRQYHHTRSPTVGNAAFIEPDCEEDEGREVDRRESQRLSTRKVSSASLSPERDEENTVQALLSLGKKKREAPADPATKDIHDNAGMNSIGHSQKQKVVIHGASFKPLCHPETLVLTSPVSMLAGISPSFSTSGPAILSRPRKRACTAISASVPPPSPPNQENSTKAYSPMVAWMDRYDTEDKCQIKLVASPSNKQEGHGQSCHQSCRRRPILNTCGPMLNTCKENTQAVKSEEQQEREQSFVLPSILCVTMQLPPGIPLSPPPFFPKAKQGQKVVLF